MADTNNTVDDLLLQEDLDFVASTLTNATREVMRLQEQLTAARYALDMAEALLRRVDVAGGGSSTLILDDEMRRRLRGSDQAHRAAIDWRKDRDAWLEARP